jgi:hypothetical protein
VSTVRLQLTGHFTAAGYGDVMYVRVPKTLCPLLVDAAGCGPASRRDEALVETNEYRHPPVYYAVVGLPSLFGSGRWVGYAMRLVSAVVACALMASAWTMALGSGRRIVVLSVVVAATPVTWLLMSQVNPNGIEAAAAIAAWAALLALVKGPVSHRLVQWCGAAVAVLVVSRATSPLYVFIMLLAAALLAGPARLTRLHARFDVRRWGVGCLAAATVAVAWIVSVGLPHNGVRTGRGLAASLGESGRLFRETVGDSLDLRVSLPLAVPVYALIAVAIVLCGLSARTRRERLVLGVVVALAVLIPITSDAFDIPPAAPIGWQGRYGLPLLAGAVLVAGYLSRIDMPRQWWRLALALVAFAHVGAFIVFARYWVDGAGVATALVVLHLAAVALTAVALDQMLEGGPHPQVVDRLR